MCVCLPCLLHSASSLPTGFISKLRDSDRAINKLLNDKKLQSTKSGSSEQSNAAFESYNKARKETQDATANYELIIAANDVKNTQLNQVPIKGTSKFRAQNNLSVLRKLIPGQKFAEYAEASVKRDGLKDSAKQFARDVLEYSTKEQNGAMEKEVEEIMLQAARNGMYNTSSVEKWLKEWKIGSSVTVKKINIRNRRENPLLLVPDAPDDLTQILHANMARNIAEVVGYSLMGSERARKYHELLCTQVNLKFTRC